MICKQLIPSTAVNCGTTTDSGAPPGGKSPRENFICIVCPQPVDFTGIQSE